MPIQFPNLPKLTAADLGGLGGFDLGSSIRSGLQNANSIKELMYKNRNLENASKAQEYANKINEAKAKYAQDQELANLQYRQAGTGNLGAQTDLTRSQIELLPYDKQFKMAQIQNALAQAEKNKYLLQQDKQFNDLISGMPSLNQQSQPNITSNKNINEQIITPGNPQLQYLNDIYYKYPQYRKKLEDSGYKQTQDIKYDPKTGTTSVITRMPNGEVRVKTSVNENIDNSAATTATKTAAQKTITAIQNARPIIQKIIDETEKGKIPGQWIGKYFQPNAQASYESDVIQSSDTLASALGFPATNEGLHQASQTILKKPRETDNGYAQRLKTLLSDLDTREETAQKNLNKGISTSNKSNLTNKKRLKFNISTGKLE